MSSIATIILAVSLIIIMFGMGLSLTIENFKTVFTHPKAVLTGLVSQLILLPLIGFGLINIFELAPEVAVGVIILAACPGGPTSNLITHLAKGDTALSVSLTAICSFITLLTIPFIINLGLKSILGETTKIQLDVVQTIIQVFAVVIVPVILGMTIRARKPGFANRMERPVRGASAVVFVLVLAGVIVSERANIIPYFQQAGLVMLTLNVCTMAVGMLLAFGLKLPTRQGISISIESGIQNGTLAISIATVLLANPTYSIAPAIYSLIMFVTSAIVIMASLRFVASRA